MSLLAAIWTSAIATALLVIGAVVTAVYAHNAYREQSRQTGEVRDQTRLLQEQADRDIRQRRRAQATQVFAWVEIRPYHGNDKDMRPAACIKNASEQPVYDIELGLELGAGKESDRSLPVLMPLPRPLYEPAQHDDRSGLAAMTKISPRRRSAPVRYRDRVVACFSPWIDLRPRPA